MKLIYGFVLIAILSLAVAIYIIVSYNGLSEKTIKMVGVLIAGLVIPLSSWIYFFKETNFEYSFLTATVVNKQTNLPVYFNYSGTSPLMERHDELGRLARILVVYDKFKTKDDINYNDVYREVLQYQLLQYICLLLTE